MRMTPWLLAMLIVGLTGMAWADCDITQPAPKTFTVRACRVVNTDREPRLQQFLRSYPEGFVESAREGMRKYAESVLTNYHGVVLDVTGEDLDGKLFLRSEDPYACAAFRTGSRMAALVGGACCDGDPNPPCYLGFREYIIPGTARPAQ